MNQRTKEFIIAICNHKSIYGHTNINAFVDGMKAIEPDFLTRQTLVKKLKEQNFAYYDNNKGEVYEIYRYTNPRYRKRFVKKESKMNQ